MLKHVSALGLNMSLQHCCNSLSADLDCKHQPNLTLQCWDFTSRQLPHLKDSGANLVVREAKIHNDASVDISADGTFLVTLVPSNLPATTVVGVYR